MAENTVTIKRGATSLKLQVIRAELNKFSALLGLQEYESAWLTLDSIHGRIDELQACLPTDNPALG